MAQTDPILAETERLHGFFQSRGAPSVEPELLQPADLLLDLYGEDIIPIPRNSDSAGVPKSVIFRFIHGKGD